MGSLGVILRTVVLAVVTAGLVVLPCMARATTMPSRSVPLPSFDIPRTALPPFQPMALSAEDWKGQLDHPPRAPGILAPIGAFGAGTILPTILFVQDAMRGYEPYRLASGFHPAELQPRFHGTALVYSAIAVGLAPAGAALFYIIGGGPVIRALGGGLFGLLFAVIGVPLGGLLALTMTSPYQDDPEANPRTVYTVYALSLYGMTTSMSLVGFFLVGKRKSAKKTASLGLQPVQQHDRVALQPTLRVRF